MPRAPCIDRTLTITECVVIMLDLKNKQNFEKQMYVAGGYPDPEDLLKHIRRTWFDTETVPVHILSHTYYRRSFHMTEDQYITYIIESEKEKELQNNEFNQSDREPC